MDCLNPDGRHSDEDRARRRGLSLGRQGLDGMSRISGWLTPEARAGLEAVWAKLAAPGMCNPEDEAAVVDGPVSRDAADRDSRSVSQRQHDGFNAALRAVLASGELGQHNGLPASIIVSTTLKELEAAAGRGLTGGGTLLPMSDVIRLARHAHHYLAVFDRGEAIGLYHAKRLATPGQRIVLYAKDRGCTRPGCDVAGYQCEVHHVAAWAISGRTDINQLTLPAARITNCSSKAGAPARTLTAIPNGSHRRTSTTDSQEPTATTTRKNCSATAPTMTTRVTGRRKPVAPNWADVPARRRWSRPLRAVSRNRPGAAGGRCRRECAWTTGPRRR